MISFSWTFFSLLKKWIWKKTSHNRASPPQTARHSIRKGKHLTTGYHDTNRRLTLYDVICYILWCYMFITYINIYIHTYWYCMRLSLSLSWYIGCPKLFDGRSQKSGHLQLYQAGVQAEALESAHEDRCLHHELSWSLVPKMLNC